MAQFINSFPSGRRSSLIGQGSNFPFPVQQQPMQSFSTISHFPVQPMVQQQPSFQYAQPPVQMMSQPMMSQPMRSSQIFTDMSQPVLSQPLQQFLPQPAMVFESQEVKTQRPKIGYTNKVIKVTKNSKVPVQRWVEKTIQIPKIVYEVQLRPVQVLSIASVPKVIEVEEEEIVQEEIMVEREVRVPQRRREEVISAHGVLVPFVHSVKGAAAAKPIIDHHHYDYYVWHAGDSLAELGQRYNCSTKQILQLNHIAAETQIHDGRVLRIPIERSGYLEDGPRNASSIRPVGAAPYSTVGPANPSAYLQQRPSGGSSYYTGGGGGGGSSADGRSAAGGPGAGGGSGSPGGAGGPLGRTGSGSTFADNPNFSSSGKGYKPEL